MRNWADKAAATIVELYGPDKIMLFGSHAKNCDGPESDIDLLIIKDTDIPRIYRGLEVVSALKRYPIKFDLLFYTNPEVAAALAKKYSFLYSILKSGTILYQRP